MSKTLNCKYSPPALVVFSCIYKLLPSIISHPLPKPWDLRGKHTFPGFQGCKTMGVASQTDHKDLALVRVLRVHSQTEILWCTYGSLERAQWLPEASKGIRGQAARKVLMTHINSSFHVMFLLAFYKSRKPTPQKTSRRLKQDTSAETWNFHGIHSFHGMTVVPNSHLVTAQPHPASRLLFHCLPLEIPAASEGLAPSLQHSPAFHWAEYTKLKDSVPQIPRTNKNHVRIVKQLHVVTTKE